jgi:hypothetical protein
MISKLERIWLSHKKPKGWIKGFSDTNSLFIHIPKTAGTSISLGLYNEDPWHYTLENYSYISGPTFRKLFKFAFVRNPYDRLESTYRYSFKQVKSHPNTSVRFITEYPSFDDFVFNWVNEDNVNAHYFLAPQHSYLRSPLSNIGIDFIGKFENLNDGYQKINKKLGLVNSLPFTNNSTAEIPTYYTNETARIVYDAYRDDFERFDYSKNSFKTK